MATKSEKLYYRVGGHCYCVSSCNDDDVTGLLSSSEPFRLSDAPSDEEPLLFRLTLDDQWRPTQRGQKVFHSDHGDGFYDVFMLPDSSFLIDSISIDGQLCSQMQAVPDFSEAVVWLSDDKEKRTWCLNNTLMMLYAFSAADQMTLLMHASVVRKEGKGYLCLGKSGTGKSTHTSNWLRYIPGTDLMNDDNPVVRVSADGVVRVYGSPWSGKTPCYRNVEAPVGAFLLLQQAPYNKIERLNVVNSLVAMIESCSMMRWDKREYSGVMDTLNAILSSVPLYQMENLPNEEAVRMSCEVMTGHKPEQREQTETSTSSPEENAKENS